MAYKPPNRFRVRWYVQDGVEGRIKGEDIIEVEDLEIYKESAQETCNNIVEKHLMGVFPNFEEAHLGCSAPLNWKVTSVKEIPLTKYEILVRTVNDVISQYDMPLTLRQIYYRLVAKQVIPNTLNEYKGLSRYLVKAREKREVDYRKIEDRTRSSHGGDSTYSSLEEYLERHLDRLHESHKYFDMKMWENQDHFIEVWIEKDALTTTVSAVCDRYNIRTCPSRGYPSFSFVAKAVERFRELKHDSIVIIYLGDYDPSGLDIPRDLENRLIRYGVSYEKLTIDRIALTRDQIEENNLPPAPAKRSDVRFQAFVDKTGSDDVVELDALEPPILQGIVKEAIEGYISTKRWNEQVKIINEEKERLKEMLMNTRIEIPDFEYRYKWEDEEEDEF